MISTTPRGFKNHRDSTWLGPSAKFMKPATALNTTENTTAIPMSRSTSLTLLQRPPTSSRSRVAHGINSPSRIYKHGPLRANDGQVKDYGSVVNLVRRRTAALPAGHAQRNNQQDRQQPHRMLPRCS